MMDHRVVLLCKSIVATLEMLEEKRRKAKSILPKIDTELERLINADEQYANNRYNDLVRVIKKGDVK